MSKRSEITRRSLIAVTGALPAAFATRGFAVEMQFLTGEVMFRERMALPPGSVVQIELLDVSLADAPARQIAVQRLTGMVGSPIPYQLEFDKAAIEAGHRYALRAQITAADGRLLFTSTSHHAAFDPGENAGRIMVQHVAAPPAEAPSNDRLTETLTGTWLVEDIAGGGVIDNLQSLLSIADDGEVNGSAGCNRFFGKATIEAEAISFGSFGATKMACPPAIMDQEQKFLRALTLTRRFQIVPQESKLLLFDEAGMQVLRLTRTQP